MSIISEYKQFGLTVKEANYLEENNRKIARKIIIKKYEAEYLEIIDKLRDKEMDKFTNLAGAEPKWRLKR